MAALGRCPLTSSRRYGDGETLFEAGDRDLSFDVIKSGSVEIIDESGEQPRSIVVLGPGEFTGDVSQLTGGPAIVTGIARGDTEVYEVSPAALRRLLNDHPDLGDIILRAFIARRHLLQESGEFVGLRVIGSGHSPETFRVREFLAKNHVPFTWFDTDDRSGGVAAPGALRGDRGRHARGGLGEQAAAAQALDPAARRCPGPSPAPGRRGLRPRRGRGRSGGAGRGGLRRLRGPEDRGPRGHGARAARPAAACGSRTTSDSPPASPAPSWPSAPSSRPTSSAPACPSPRRSPAWNSPTDMPCSTSRAANGSRPGAC